jgi:hypothetical protein
VQEEKRRQALKLEQQLMETQAALSARLKTRRAFKIVQILYKKMITSYYLFMVEAE